jgi:TM2 domain-containing membrane protein YozV
MQRTDDPGIIEQRLLDMAYTTDSKITAPALAYYAMCSIEDATDVLDNLVKRDRIRMEVEDDGTIVYLVPDRHKLVPRNEGVALDVIKPAHIPLAIRDGRVASPGLAAVLSLVLPGAGQLYAGRPVAALLWFILVGLGYMLFLPGLILHVFCIGSAAGAAHRLNSSLYQLQLATRGTTA